MSGPNEPLPPPGEQPGEPVGGRRARPFELRRMGVGEILAGAIKLYAAKWATLMGLVAAVVVPLGLLQSLVGTPPALRGAANWPAGAVEALEGLLVFAVVKPAMAKTAADAYLGEPTGIAQTYRYAAPLIVSLLWVAVLAGLAVMGGFILLIIPGVFLLVRFHVALIVVVVEGERGTQALRRSWRLVTGHSWRVLGIVVLVELITTVAALILAAPFVISEVVTAPGFVPETSALTVIGGMLASVLVAPLGSLATVLLYFDLRVRTEGFNLELLARDLVAGSGRGAGAA